MGVIRNRAPKSSKIAYQCLQNVIYALPLATQQYIKGAAFPAARLLGPNNINNTYSNLE